ncbi:redoxin domain-containing protein [Hydrogenophaga sp. 2FB]|uniref:redoxin domain-containing protein n=1 Tax=Hydrogenophaga sp. 2FB TaxID=2502187 RepID=UPI0010F77FE9|nr:redoxin domain-containing protein [Hydrogenophaga sp. 2FB]
MKNLIAVAAVLMAVSAAPVVYAQAVVGQPAPAFQATDVNGKPVQLSDFAGKHVVLEWFNPGCPFVQKHYNSGNMPATQKAALAKGAVWISINSDAREPGDKKAATTFPNWLKDNGALPTAVILDGAGTIGKAYGARATPHMFVIDPTGKLVYAGAIDSKPSTNPDDIQTATNYVGQALNESMAGKAVSKPRSQVYGCSIHYGWGNAVKNLLRPAG